MPLGSGTPSLTRQLPLESYRKAAAAAIAGMTPAEARQLLLDKGADDARWEELFLFDGPVLVEDEVVRLSRDGDQNLAHLLIFLTRVWADHRLAAVLETGLTTPEGKLIPERINATTVQASLETVKNAVNSKDVSNVLGYMEQAHLIRPQKHGSSIVGVEELLPTSGVVPSVVTLVRERAPRIGLRPPAGADPVDLALGLGINHWVNLTPGEFRRAANPPASPATPVGRAAPPSDLQILDDELRRRGQVVLQGAPGVGKTYEAVRYVNWASAGSQDASHLSSLLSVLPSHERTPRQVAEAVITQGLTAVWDLVQFHPSYGYEDFVRTLAPRPRSSGMTFVAEHRPMSFLSAVGQHLLSRGSKADVILVVDEINRADISRVFGELLYGLEYRNTPVATPHEVDGSNSLVVPENLLLVGTMNTADRSIALIDYALRRRFTFLNLSPQRHVIERAAWQGPVDRSAALRLYDLTAALFIGPEPGLAALAVGHSYFLPVKATTVEESLDGLARRFAYEVHPLLQEYAAEGLLDNERVNEVTTTLGIGPDEPRDQQGVAAATRSWLQPAAAPSDAAPEAGGDE